MILFNILDNFFIISVLEAISIIPLHKQVAPSNVNVKSIALCVESKIELFILSIFPENIAKIIDIIIKIGHNIFNISPPSLHIYYTNYKNITIFFTIF